MCFRSVAARMLEKKTVEFKNETLLISEPCESSETQATPPVNSAPSRSCSQSIKVTNVEPTLSKEMLTMYFENSKRSHGGDIKDFQLLPEKKKAFITFKDPAGMPT